MVSIIMPAYNSASFLSEAIESVIAQTYDDWELIVVNDCSEDDTADIARIYGTTDPRILLLETKGKQGASGARNLGTEWARGDFIAFIDSDDVWLKDKLRIQMKAMLNRQALFSFTSYNVVSRRGDLIRTIKAPQEISYSDLLRGCNIGCSTVVYNAKQLNKQYFLSPPSLSREDYVLWLELSKVLTGSMSMMGVDIPLVNYRKHGGGISARKSKTAWNQWKVYREIERLPLFYSLYYFVNYAVNGLKKHYL